MKARFHPLSDLLLERYLAGELDAAEARRIEEHAATRPELEQYLRTRRAEREAFKLRRPPLALPTTQRPPWFAWRWAFAAVAVSVAVALVVVLRPGADTEGQGRVAVRGNARLELTIAVQRGAEVFSYREGVLLLPGDRIRLTVKVPDVGSLTAIALDARRQPQVLYDAVLVSGETVLPDSLELDDTPGEEELVLFFSRSPLTGLQALERVRRGDLGDATVVRLSKGSL